jgi:hypothetical protein
VLPGHHAQPCRALAPILDRGGRPDGSHHGGRSQGANPLKLRQPLIHLMARKHVLNLCIGLLDALIHGLEFCRQRL